MIGYKQLFPTMTKYHLFNPDARKKNAFPKRKAACILNLFISSQMEIAAALRIVALAELHRAAIIGVNDNVHGCFLLCGLLRCWGKERRGQALCSGRYGPGPSSQ